MIQDDPELSKLYFQHHFSALKDPRRTSKGNLIYPLEEILFLTISATVCGCNTWTAIAEFGKLKLDWLQKFFPYQNAIPSHDVLGDLFSILDNKAFVVCFMEWVQSISTISNSEVIALDGKTVRGVASCSRKYPLHIVTAFCTKNRICLAQQTVEDKSNEITAIPEILDLLTLQGCIVTTDAMGCQKKIAEKIRSKAGEYILQVKGNQQELKEQIEKLFKITPISSSDTQYDAGHGRIETRICEVINQLDFLDDREEWTDLNSVVRINSERIIKKTGEQSQEYRYYISSIKGNAELLNNSIRSHWGIENNLHHSLDVIFKEDGQLKRKGNSAENFNIIAKVCLGMIENEKTQKLSKPMKMLRATISDEYREKVLKV